MAKRFFFLFVILPFLGSSIFAQEETWVERFEKDGILVYTSKVDGSDMDAFRGIMEVESSASAIVALLQDVENYNNWMYRTDIAKLLKKEENTIYVYSTSEAPWPVKSRDNVHVCRMVQNTETKEIVITIETIPDYIPHKNNYVRIPEGKGYWLITPLGKRKTKIKFQMRSNPGGSIPAWMANISATQAPYQTLLNMREEIKKPKYRFAKIQEIQEF